ncbi:(2Fe-2S) ferredoxin [Nakamurella sp. UYEF19]|uniref:hypothetical protein n=1 Tax=Nakamurella sp. UYEF19 TaxID=1756392 RepID=UPI00339575FC
MTPFDGPAGAGAAVGVDLAKLRATVTVCRGCCCGTARKHPEVDHDEQLRRLTAAVGDIGQIRVVKGCLGQCERSNVMVVTPSTLGRLFGGRPIWLGRILDQELLTAVAEWINSAGPGLAPMPDVLRRVVFAPLGPIEPTATD